MGRKDISEERRNQILDAFERCIVEHGLSGATLAKIAEKAQVNRGLIHHYIGNRNDLLSALMQRRSERIREGYTNYLSERQDDSRLDTILNYLFDEWAGVGPDDDLIFTALVAETPHDPHVHQLIMESYSVMEERIAVELKNHYSSASLEQCQDVAYAIMAMESGNSTMLWLGYDRSKLPAIRLLVKALIQTLDKED